MRVVSPPAPRSDPTIDLLQQILDVLLRIEAAQTRRSSTLSRADHARLVRLLPAIVGARGSDEFTVAELLEEHRSVRLVLDGLDVQAIGRLLYRATNIPVDGYVVLCRGEELNRRRWSVERTV
jgi:hypothetical protein